MSAARGAISLLAKAWTVSRIASAVSPRSKLKIRYALGIMGVVPPANQTLFETGLFGRIALVTARIAVVRGRRRPKAGMPACGLLAHGKLPLASTHMTGCNSHKMPPAGDAQQEDE